MDDEKPSLDEALAHFGIKGMKWGVRKREGGVSKSKISRKENRTLNREARNEFNSKKLSTLVDEAQKGSLIRAHTPEDPYGTVLTGQEFVARMAAGRYLNIKLTEVYARPTGRSDAGKDIYELQKYKDRIGTYKKQNFRKNPPTKG